LGAFEKAIELIEGDLSDGETVVASIKATRVEKGSSGAERGALVLTNKKLAYYGAAWFNVSSRIEWRLEQLNGVAATKSLAYEHIEVNAGGAVVQFLVNYGEANGFVVSTNSAMADSKPAPLNQQASNPADNLQELERISQLFEKGLLTEEEFTLMKSRLLAK
jgi:hypothetical protein